MGSIGVPPGPTTLITGFRIELFGLLSQSKIDTEEECHFCMEPVRNVPLYTTDTACCHKAIHCRCFETWTYTSTAFTNNPFVRCAYCRANYTHPCFLCLPERRDSKPTKSKNNVLPCHRTRRMCARFEVHTVDLIRG